MDIEWMYGRVRHALSSAFLLCGDGMTEREGGGGEGVWVGQRREGREHDTLVVIVRCHVIFSSVFLAVSVSLVLHADPKK